MRYVGILLACWETPVSQHTTKIFVVEYKQPKVVYKPVRRAIKLRAQKKTQQDLKKLYNTDKLQDRKIRRDFCISLWNKYDVLAVEAKDSESVEEK
ncbi:hypothetical protein QYM36_016567 [Artemia franciscana]|uniref:Uncharacterized protein n=1 Tax=Artemia franciscana TaxID=6661 RepID=A0AA88KTU5_ARTSF|nr:hypothetical protein QYM36_016567 [Artemia franciscana]